MPARPLRVKAQNELGKTCSLSDDQRAFVRSGHGSRHIFLGLGPRPERLKEMTPQARDVSYIEPQAFLEQMSPAWHQAIPAHYKKIRPQDLTPEDIADCTVWTYLPGHRMFPSFWGPLLAKVQLWQASLFDPPEENLVMLPYVPGGLIIPEISSALRKRHIRPLLLPDRLSSTQLAELLSTFRPRLFLSVNLAGLDAYGEHFYLLREAGVPVVVWLVDNPFHLLSKLKAPFWKKIPMGVTDDWFIPPLENMGGRPFHLPLATDPQFFQPQEQPAGTKRSPEVTFVGRSAFPQKKGFFAGSTVSLSCSDQARETLNSGRIPDFSWWLARLEIESLWPEKDVRRAGFGAEETSLFWRTVCLNQAARSSRLVVVGDDGWKKGITAPFTLHSPMDYYGPLAAWYHQASITMNMTSLLLPHGLTQRHFDVWAAGGFLITDATPGLNIFPKELTRAITFGVPSDIPALIQRFSEETPEKEGLRTAWRNEILAHHTYSHRLEKILEFANKEA